MVSSGETVVANGDVRDLERSLVVGEWGEVSCYLWLQWQLARPCEEKNGHVRGRDGLKRKRK